MLRALLDRFWVLLGVITLVFFSPRLSRVIQLM